MGSRRTHVLHLPLRRAQSEGREGLWRVWAFAPVHDHNREATWTYHALLVPECVCDLPLSPCLCMITAPCMLLAMLAQVILNALLEGATSMPNLTGSSAGSDGAPTLLPVPPTTAIVRENLVCVRTCGMFIKRTKWCVCILCM